MAALAPAKAGPRVEGRGGRPIVVAGAGYVCVYHHLLGEGNGTPLQYSCLENPMDGGTW